MSPAESTSAASEPSAWPSWPPNSAPPSVATIDCIGPSWARGLLAAPGRPSRATMRPATGSQSLLPHVEGVVDPLVAVPRDRGRGCRTAARTPGSSHRSARRSASSTALRSNGGDRRVARRAQLAGRDLAGQVPVDRAAARRGEHLLQLSHELLHLLRVVGVGRLGARQREAERDIRHAVQRYARRRPYAGPGVALRENSGFDQRNSGTAGYALAHETSRCHGPPRRADHRPAGRRCASAAPIPYVVLGPGPDRQHARLARTAKR